MDGFQITVLGVAVSLLIIILAVVGVIMTSNKKNLIFPPSSLPCPNYWQMNADGKCVIPVAPPTPSNMGSIPQQYTQNYVPVNIGTWDKAKEPIYGLDTTTGTVNFSDSGWGASAGSATCEKQKWAKKVGIFWDGVTNYNGCA